MQTFHCSTKWLDYHHEGRPCALLNGGAATHNAVLMTLCTGTTLGEGVKGGGYSTVLKDKSIGRYSGNSGAGLQRNLTVCV